MATVAYSGIRGDLSIGGTALHCTKWDVTYRQAQLESTSKADSGFETYVAGKRGADWSATAFFDGSIQSGDPPFPMAVAAATASFVISDSAGTTVKTIAFSAVVESMAITSDKDGLVEYTVSGKSTGTITVS